MAKISVAMIVKDGARTLKRSLESLKDFDDVVVYDNGSKDESIKIASSFPNVRLFEGEFLGFGATKNRAVGFTKHDWVLILDADEVVDAKLSNALKDATLSKKTIYQIRFQAFYKELKINYCGWNNQKIRRLFNKTVTRFNDNYVHETIKNEGLSVKLFEHGHIEHYSYHSLSDFILKADRYSSLYAKNNVGKKKSSPTKAFFNATYSFIKTYFFKRGFLDGWVGLVISYSHMITNFFKYMKLYEANKEAGFQ